MTNQRNFVIVSFNGASILCLDSLPLRHVARDFASVRPAKPHEITSYKLFDTRRIVKRLQERRDEWNLYMNGAGDLKNWDAIVAKNHSSAHSNMLKLTR